MSVDYKTLVTLANPKTKQVLRTVVKGKAVRLRELVRDDITQEEALQAIDILKEAALVKETPSPIADLKTYFVTASGLQADRAMQG